MKNLRKGSPARGFTLIELMIAVAIVAILVAVAVPAYNDYTIRSKVAECINHGAVAKVHIAEYRQSLGPWPPSAAAAALDAAGDTEFCSVFSYTPATGAFTIEVDEAAIDSEIQGEIAPLMTPTATASNFINWNCTQGSTAIGNVKYLPSTCRDT